MLILLFIDGLTADYYTTVVIIRVLVVTGSYILGFFFPFSLLAG